MFGVLAQRSSVQKAPSVPPRAVDDVPDDISLTSTTPDQGNNDAEEFVVDSILAEADGKNGKEFLIEWENFPLWQCTWEVEENIGDELRAMWEDDKQKQAAGLKAAFDTRIWEKAKIDAETNHARHHARRNAKRKRLNIPETPLIRLFPDEELLGGVIEDSSDSDAPMSRGRQIVPPKRPQQTREKRRPSGPPHPSATGREAGKLKKPKIEVKTEVKTEIKTEIKTEGKRSKPATNARPPGQRISTSGTGYQGTARNPPAKSPTTATTGVFRTPAPGQPYTNRTSSLASKFKAKKTKPKPNIFREGAHHGGQGRRLEVQASDPTREQKFFRTHHVTNLARLRSRNKEDDTPDLQVMEARLREKAADPTAISPSDISAVTPGPTVKSMPERSRSALAAPKLATSERPRRRVQFSLPGVGDNRGGAEPMDLDNNQPTASRPRRSHSPTRLQRGNPPPLGYDTKPSLDENGRDDDDDDAGPISSRRRTFPPATAGRASGKKLTSLAAYRSARLVQDSDAWVKFGSSTPVELVFHGLPRDAQLPWLHDFFPQGPIEFRCQVLAQTFIAQQARIVETMMREGSATAKESSREEVVDIVAQHLRGSLLGVVYPRGEYCLLIYPTRCDEWNTDQPPPSGGPAGAEGAQLRYKIFKTPAECELLLPLPLLGPKLEKGAQTDTSGLELVEIARDLLSFDYYKLLPRLPARKALRAPPQPRSFYLAFPESKSAAMAFFMRWLRACDPQCLVYTSKHPGSWLAWQAAVAYQPGAVIMHELLARSLHRIPKLGRHIADRGMLRDLYWCFSEPVQPFPLYPSMPPSDEPAPLGAMRLIELFPMSSAILLTPSFLVSEPQGASQFLYWYLCTWLKMTKYKIVTAHNIHEYLWELALQKSDERDQLRQGKVDAGTYIEEEMRRLRLEDCNSRLQAAASASEIHNYNISRVGSYGAYEDAGTLVYADQSIDPNDEQSLVNWYGWWSAMHADQCRKFFVLGSSPLSGSRARELTMRIPSYTKTTINDPDAVLEVLQEHEEKQAAETKTATGEAAESAGQEAALVAASVSAAQSAAGFTGDVPASDGARDLEIYFDNVVNMCKSDFKWMVHHYRFPVSWVDFDMSDHFDMFNPPDFKRFPDWWNYVHPFADAKKPPMAKARFNTYVGFFYTIAEDWVKENFPAKQMPKRHPWLAFYRPVNPHIRPYTDCELLMWDPLAHARFPGQQAPRFGKLTDMQRRFIQYVSRRTGDKNPGSSLRRVWLGGFDMLDEFRSPSTIDTTMKYLGWVLADLKIRLPAAAEYLKRPPLGWREVRRSTPAGADGDDNDDVPMDISVESGETAATNERDEDNESKLSIDDDIDDDIDDADARVIFHPPRAPGPQQQQTALGYHPPTKSRCMNRLYEASRLARLSMSQDTSKATTMTYRFQPTEAWYEEQCREGRGYGHMVVEQWESIFSRLEIDKSSAVAAAAAAAATAKEAQDQAAAG